MKHLFLFCTMAVAAVAQDYQGSDIANAIPIEFGQKIADTLDPTLRPRLVYAVNLARGQRFTATVRKTANRGGVWVGIFDPRLTTLGSSPNSLATTGYQYGGGATLEYAVPTAGTYYLGLYPDRGNGGFEFDLTIAAVGARLDVPLPAATSCLEGNVDDIQFNLQQVSLNLAEELTVGGTKICATCSVKPTLFPAFVDFLRQAHFAGTRVQVCYGSDGQIVRVKSARQ